VPLSAGGLTGVTPSARQRVRLVAPALRLAPAVRQPARAGPLALRAVLSAQERARVTLSPALRLALSARQRTEAASLALWMAVFLRERVGVAVPLA